MQRYPRRAKEKARSDYERQIAAGQREEEMIIEVGRTQPV